MSGPSVAYWHRPAFSLLALLGLTTVAFASSSGEYLTRAADCVSCHTAEGGAPFAGGRAIKLPFGTIYSPNITPDRETGIGDYTDDEWVDALQRGIGHGGKQLYPVMPYNSYTLMSREDALAIKGYLFSLKPVHAEAPANSLRFPFSQRWTLWLWNKANNPDHRFVPDSTKSAAWNRGAYLVEALGHCGQCHTPRNWMQGLKTGDAYAGTVQAGWRAYNITNDPKHGIGGWSDAALAQYLSTGFADGHGPASGPMAEAITNSLRYMTPDDIRAMVTYLRDIPPQAQGPESAPPAPAAVADTALGAHIFELACAGCHLPNGHGRQSPWAALAGDQSAADPAATNLLQVLAHGSELRTDHGEVFMHSFAGAYTDPELAAVANFVMARFGGRPGVVMAEDIAAAKR